MNFTKILLSIALGCAVVASIVSCTDPISPDAPTTAKLDNLLARWEKDNSAMGGVAFTKGGKILYQNYTGSATISGNSSTKADSNTIYQVASITKIFTSVIIHQLIDEQRLQLTAKLSDFFPQIAGAENITIRHLLQHRSGLHNWTTDTDLETWAYTPQTREQMLARFATYKTEFAPDEKRYYSNTNYSLLGYIIENITRTSYAEQVRIRIVNKVGLTHTYDGSFSAASRPFEAQSFTRDLFSWKQAKKTDLNALLGTGSIFSTPLDICRFLEALFAGKLVSAAALASITTPDSQQKGDLGKGIDKEALFNNSLDTFTKSGRIDGFTGQAFYFPADGIAGVVLLNGFTRTNIIFEPVRVYYGK
jgi:D-alanyl-D-alanine carboxypeptidase